MSADSAFEHTVIPQKDLALELTARAAFTQGGDVNPKMYVVNRRKSYSFTTEKSHSQRGVLVAKDVCCQAASTVLIHTWCPLWVGAIADAIYTHCTQRNAWRE